MYKDMPKYFKKVMLHEWLMLAFMLEVVIRLAVMPQISIWSIYYVTVACVYIGLIYWGINCDSMRLSRIRLFAAFFIMSFSYSSIRYLVPALDMPIFDYKLANIDTMLVGGDLSLLAQNIYSRPLTEIMSIGYMLHFAPFIIGIIYYGFFGDNKRTYLFYSGLFSVLAIGFIGYSFVPAMGPFAYFDGQYTKALVGYYFTDINAKMVVSGSSVFDVFPSMHVGVATFLLLFFFGNNKTAFRYYLPLYTVIVCSTIYLRYHYFIDILCGAIVSILVYNICQLLSESFEKEEETKDICEGIPEIS